MPAPGTQPGPARGPAPPIAAEPFDPAHKLLPPAVGRQAVKSRRSASGAPSRGHCDGACAEFRDLWTARDAVSFSDRGCKRVALTMRRRPYHVEKTTECRLRKPLTALIVLRLGYTF